MANLFDSNIFDSAIFDTSAVVVVVDDSRTAYTSSGGGAHTGIFRHWGRLASLRAPAGISGSVNQSQGKQQQRIVAEVVSAEDIYGAVSSDQQVARSTAKGKIQLVEITAELNCRQSQAGERGTGFTADNKVSGGVTTAQDSQEVFAVGNIDVNAFIGASEQSQSYAAEFSSGDSFKLETVGIVAEAQEIVRTAARGSVDASYEEELLMAIL